MLLSKKNELPLILLGSGGHAKVVLSTAQAMGKTVLGVCDPEFKNTSVSTWRGIKVLGDDNYLENIDPSLIGLINGIGQVVGSSNRMKIFENFSEKGFFFPNIIHPTAFVDSSVKLSGGVQVMAGVVIQADCTIGKNTIINTQASVDHDCYISKHTHLAPGVTLCGSVKIYPNTFLGAGSIVLPGLSLGANSILAAGLTLRKNLVSNEKYVTN